MSLITLNQARFFDKDGMPCGKCGFKLKDKKFNWKRGDYLVDATASYTDHLIIPLLLSRRRWFYNQNSSKPMRFYKNFSHQALSPEELNILLDTKVLIDLNTPHGKTDWKKILKYGIIALLVGGVLYYILSGHSLTGGSTAVINSSVVNG